MHQALAHPSPRLFSILIALAIVPTACFDPRLVADTEDATDDGNTTTATDGSTTEPATTIDPDSSGEPPAVCGNGVVEGSEACDDGVNDGSYGGCNADCSAPGPFCGDGVLNGEEPCDDGDDVDGNGCNVDCVVSGSVLWTVTYDGPDHGVDSAAGVAVDAADNIIVAGSIAAEERRMAWLRKYTPEGASAWTEFFPSDIEDSSAGPVATLASNDIVFGGEFDTEDPTTSPDAWLRRITGQGSSTWTRTHSSPQGLWDTVNSLDIDTDGYIYVLFTESSQGFVRKYDENGAELWTIFLDETLHPWQLATDADGGSVIVGNDLSEADFMPFITKLNSDGGTEWTQTLTDYDNAYLTTVDIGANGDFVAGLVSVDSSERILFFDSEGAPTGEIFPHTEDSTILIEEVLLLGNGQLVASGTKGNDGHLWVTKYATDGMELWTHTYNGDDWGYGFDVATSLRADSAGNIIAVGLIQETEATLQDIWVTKLAP